MVVALVLFGPKRLPEIARQIGKIASWIQRASQEFRDQLMSINEESRDRPGAQNDTASSTGPESDLLKNKSHSNIKDGDDLAG